MTRAEEVFKYELNLIGDENIRSFVVNIFDKLTPAYFWTVPCSTSGKYHPKVVLGEGGLVRHVKLAVWWALELMCAFEPQLHSSAKDEIIAAVLLHDLKKNGESLDADGRPTLKNAARVHGVYLANQIVGTFPEVRDQYINILEAIAGHMGIWTSKDDYDCWPETQGGKAKIVCDIVHLADYCASCKVDDAYVWIQQ